jgi:hypothetical protein
MCGDTFVHVWKFGLRADVRTNLACARQLWAGDEMTYADVGMFHALVRCHSIAAKLPLNGCSSNRKCAKHLPISIKLRSAPSLFLCRVGVCSR